MLARRSLLAKYRIPILLFLFLLSFLCFASILHRLSSGTSVPNQLLHQGVLRSLGDVKGNASAQDDEVTNSFYLPLIAKSTFVYLPLIRSPSVLLEPHPPVDSIGTSTNTYLSWRLDLPDADRFRYTLLLDANRDDPQTVIATNLAETSFDPTTFEPGKRYSWRVIATTSQGDRIEGPIWVFETMLDTSDPPDIDAMVTVPSGPFLMGCDSSNSAQYCTSFEVPLHQVYLDEFRIDKYEVTNTEYRACVAAGSCAPPRKTSSRLRSQYFDAPEYDYYPVLFVSRWDAEDFCRWEDKRLPTEAEWEKAARGTVDTRAWPWGDEFPTCDRMNFTDTSGPGWVICVDDTMQVGSYPSSASPYGAMDMAGNAFEWVADIFRSDYYRNSPSENPPGPTEPEGILYYVIRGGSYRPNWFYPQVSHRHYGHHGDRPFQDAPFYRNDQVGFRCADS